MLKKAMLVDPVSNPRLLEHICIVADSVTEVLAL